MTNSQPIKEILKDALKTTQESCKESRTMYESARQKIRELSDELNRFNISLVEIEREFYDIYSLLLQKNQKLEGWIEAIIKMNDLNSIPEASPADQIPEGEVLPKEDNNGNSYEPTPESQTLSAESTTSIANQQDQSVENKEEISEKIKRIYPPMKHFYQAIEYIKVIQSNILPKLSTKLSSAWIPVLYDHLQKIYGNAQNIESSPIWLDPSHHHNIDDQLSKIITTLNNQLNYLESQFILKLWKKVLDNESKDELWWTLLASLQKLRDKIYDFLEAIPHSNFRSIISAHLLNSEEIDSLGDNIKCEPFQSKEKPNTHLHIVSRGFELKIGEKWEPQRPAIIITSGGMDSKLPPFPTLPDYVRYKPRKT